MPSPPSRAVSPGLVAFVLSALVVVVIVWLGRAHPDLAGRIGAEDDLVEWLQVGLLAVGAIAAATAAWRLSHGAGQPATLETLIAVWLAALISGEVDLDRRIFGVKIIATRFLVNPRYPLPTRMAAAVIMVSVLLALAVYMWRRRRELWHSARVAVGKPWARPILAGAAILFVTEMFERQIRNVQGWPRNYLEESLELVSAVNLVVGLVARHGAIVRER